MKTCKIILLVLSFLLLGLSLAARAEREVISLGAAYALFSDDASDGIMRGPGFYLYGLSQPKKEVPLALICDAVISFPDTITISGVEYDSDIVDGLVGIDMILGLVYTRSFSSEQIWINAGGGVYFSTINCWVDSLSSFDFLLGTGLSAGIQFKPSKHLFFEAGIHSALAFLDYWKISMNSVRGHYKESGTSFGIYCDLAARLGMGIQY